MHQKFSQLSFIIGLFFSIVAGILAANALWLQSGGRINMYTAAVFLVFGVAMMLLRNKPAEGGE